MAKKKVIFDPGTYHVSQDLGDGWLEHAELDHIAERIRHLAVPIGALVEDPSNVRIHPDTNLEGIRGSYAKYKQRVLVVVNTRTMVAEKGNGSLRILRAAGYSYVSVLFVDDDPATATGFAIADNRTAETAAWDLPELFDQLASLKELDYSVPGIDDAFLEELEVLVNGATFSPLPEQPDDEVELPDGTCKFVVRVKDDASAVDAIKAINELFQANQEWEGSVAKK